MAINLLVISRQFYPVLGGVPVVADLLHRGLRQLGHEALIVTETPDPDEAPSGLVIREPSLGTKMELMRWADVVISIGVSVRSSWQTLLSRKPHIVSHQAGTVDSTMKAVFLKSAINAACSRWLAERLGGLKATAIPNPYDDEKFRIDETAERDSHFAFCGRVTEEKGIFDLLIALKLAIVDRPKIKLTVIGDGMAMPACKAFVSENELQGNVRFLGRLSHGEIATECNRHICGIVPSRWQEPFGITALELAACGLWVIGARTGGLPEAVGATGEIYEIGNHVDLARRMIERFDSRDVTPSTEQQGRKAHLARHTPKAVAARYLELVGA